MVTLRSTLILILLAYTHSSFCSQELELHEETAFVDKPASSLFLPGMKAVLSTNQCGPDGGGLILLDYLLLGIGAHVECAKAYLQHYKHGEELRSFFKSPPVNAVHELAITLYTDPDEETKIVQNKNPLELIREANDFVITWIREKKKPGGWASVKLAASVTTNRGRTIHLSTQLKTWNEREGIEGAIRKLFLLTGKTPTQKVFDSAFFSALSAILFFPPALFFKKRLFP